MSFAGIEGNAGALMDKAADAIEIVISKDKLTLNRGEFGQHNGGWRLGFMTPGFFCRDGRAGRMAKAQA